MMRELMKSWKCLERDMIANQGELEMSVSLMEESVATGRDADVSTYRVVRNAAGDVHMK